MVKGLLLSGGIDSTALAYWKRPDIAFTVDYGQAPAIAEISAARVVAEALSIPHYIIKVDCSSLGSGDLLNKEALALSPSSEWWPYRNQLLVTLTCMKAIGFGVTELMTASVKSDGFHKDGTAEFYELMSQLMTFQEGNIKIYSPCISMSSVELVEKSGISADLLFWAHSCHTGNIACGHCRGCNKYRQVIDELQQSGVI